MQTQEGYHHSSMDPNKATMSLLSTFALVASFTDLVKVLEPPLSLDNEDIFTTSND